MSSIEYHERHKLQSLLWAMGHSYHNHIDDECCPDFSCCFSDMHTEDEEDRWQYFYDKYGKEDLQIPLIF